MYKTHKKNNRKNFRRRPSRKRQAPASNQNYLQYINKNVEQEETKVYENNHEFFEEFGINKDLLNKIKSKGYNKPSEIQDKTIEHSLQGKDIIGIAGTGTGKTAAFLIPIIQQIIENPGEDFALVIAPTRELANQVNEEFLSLTRGSGLFSTCLIGGSSLRDNLKALRRKNHIIIGTPGRLQDMAQRRALRFDKFKVLVLDEFDRMLDMGFSKEMQEINAKMVNKQQTLLFSATSDATQKELIKEMTNEPLRFEAAQSTHKTNSIIQDVMRVNGQDKFKMLTGLINENSSNRTILFCETKRKADQVSKQLVQSQIKSDAIHGDKSQKAREIALRKFKKGQVQVLVATDVVARGIDVQNVELVINYEAPRNYTDYVHRIGRTGRAGKTGRAITFIN